MLEILHSFSHARADIRQLLRTRDIPAHLEAPTSQPRILYDMERPQALSNLWLIIQTIGWIAALEGVAEYYSDRHSHNLFRRFVALILDRDPATPQPPDNWEDWYNN